LEVILDGQYLEPGTLYGFDDVYYSSDSIKQGNGYWIRASAAGQISLNCSTGTAPKLAKSAGKKLDLSQFPNLKFSDASGSEQNLYLDVTLEKEESKLKYSVPPLPPAGAFDVRFSGDYRICEDEEAMIQVQSSNFPLSISISNMTEEAEFQYVIKEILTGEEEKTYVLKEGSSIEITNAEVKSLKLCKEEIVPLTFMVQQNFPNPFNPVTKIKYGIPHAEKVKIVIYNTLGQKVKTLVSKNQKAGYYEVIWDATNENGFKVGSGIYFYSVKAGKNVANKKMVLIR